MPISVSVNVKKLDKDRFYHGKKGLYADLVLWENEEGSEASDYGDFIVKQKGEAGDRMPILGNAKHFELKERRGKNGKRSQRQTDEDGQEIPF
jgi:hypothetical protein